ncbi:MAG: phosphoribosylformylglycinamidine synthase subunit PurQ [bacterium]|nr:phosphoribosylformylglycinamidine synthase subunit PurQ [bacterium]
MKAGIITFPGSNCDRDMQYVLENFFQAQVSMLWHREAVTENFDLIVVPGGFSYGDYLRAGAIARVAPAMQSLVEHVKRGGAALGICNGFQILCEAGLLPGALIRNQSLKHICKDVELDWNPANPFAADLAANGAGRRYRIPVSHSDGNYRVDPDVLKEMQDREQIAFRYVENPNGSIESIAGVSDSGGRVLGMMPHPERATDPLTTTLDPAIGGDASADAAHTDGHAILKSLLARCAAAV